MTKNLYRTKKKVLSFTKVSDTVGTIHSDAFARAELTKCVY